MGAVKHSRQRDAIKTFLMSRKTTQLPMLYTHLSKMIFQA